MKPAVLTVLFLGVAFSNISFAREARTDHPLIAAYEGSTIKRKSVQQFDEYGAFTGMDETGKQPTGIALEGKITKIIYSTPTDRSILEIFRNYQAAVQEAGADVLYTCNQKKLECAARYAGRTLQKYSDIHSISNLDGRYLLARVKQDEHTAYVAIAVGPNSSTIHVVEVKDMDTGMVRMNAGALGSGLDAKGYVIVEGIYFDTDKATLQPTSKPALEEVSKLLTARPTLKVFVVGHTDIQGSYAHNRTLSENRAKAVVAELAASYSIANDRMEGYGVGPLAPKATNNTESGRALNRRVVLVAR